jgi:hypothetical protein
MARCDGTDCHFAVCDVELVTGYSLVRGTARRLDGLQRGVGRVEIEDHDVGAEGGEHLAGGRTKDEPAGEFFFDTLRCTTRTQKLELVEVLVEKEI